MRRILPVLPLAAVVLALSAQATVAAEAEVRVVSSDAAGTTLRLTIPEYRLEADGDEGRQVPTVEGLARTGEPGRPRLPYASALLALPPGTRPVVRVVTAAAEEARSGVRVAIGAKPEMEPDPKFGMIPVLTPMSPTTDGVWPAQAFELGEVFTMRERRMVAVQLFPFHYDEATATLSLTRELVVRVDFVRDRRAMGEGEVDTDPDPQFDPVFATQVLNWNEARGWRGRRPEVRDRGGLLPRRATGSSAATGPTLQVVEENADEVRVRIDTTGVYAIPYDSLSIYGYPANIDIHDVSVHRHEFRENETPPFETIDLPCEVDDDGDGVFGPGDQVVVWVWDWARRSRASLPQRVWGEAEVIFVTSKPNAAQIQHRSAWLGRTDLTPPASYPFTRHFERNLAMTGTPIDTLLDQFPWTSSLSYCTPSNFQFEVNDLDPTVAGNLTVRWLGAFTVDHITWAAVLNGLNQTNVVVDSAQWYGIREEERTGVIPPGALTEGNTNRLRLWGKNVADGTCADFPPPIDNSGLNSFDVQYWRSYVPIRDYLSCNSGTQTGDYELRCGPFINPFLARAYDVSDSLNPKRLDNVVVETVGSDVFLRLQDPASATRRHYVVFDIPRSPAPGAMSRVTRHRVFDHTEGDYLIIAPQGYLSAIQPLADFRTAQGLKVVVAPLEGIQDEFNGGRKSAYAIKRFVRYAYNRWNARFVLLVGDGSEDPLKIFPLSSPDIVPVQKMFGAVPISVGTVDFLRELIPSDFWYVWCLNCANTQGQPLRPDLYIGRLPVNSVAQLNGVVSKLIGYENLSGDQSWRRKVTLLSDDMYSGATTFGGGGSGVGYCRRQNEYIFATLNAITDSLIHKTGGLAQTQVDLLNMSYYLPNRPGEFIPSGAADTCRISLDTFKTRARATATIELFNELNAGRMWWNYQGHANENVISHEDIYINNGGTTTDDKTRFINTGKPFLFTGFSCHPNSFGRIRGGNDPQFGPSIGEELINLPGGGAVASWASVGYEQLPIDPTRHLALYLARAMFVNPPRDEVLGDRGSRQVLGEVLMSTLLANYQGRLNNPYERDVTITYVLLGDPATRLSLGPPQSAVTANAVPVTSGQEIRLHTAGPGLVLNADLISSVRLDSIELVRRDYTGTTPIWKSGDPVPSGLSVTPQFPDTAVSTSVNGGRRFRLILNDNLRPFTQHYLIRTVDRYKLSTTFDALFNYQVVLRVGGQAILDGDLVSPSADLSLLVLSPKPLVPSTDLTLTVGTSNQGFTAAPANGDASGREWILSWTHSPYAAGDYVVQLAVQGGQPVPHNFRVGETGAGVRLVNAYAFPNPFDEDNLRSIVPGYDVATVFSFDLISATPADVTLRVYTISGRLIYERTERRLDPRWHQLAWNGFDAEGSPLANGVYFYKLLATNGTGTAVYQGRLVKLRKPRRLITPTN